MALGRLQTCGLIGFALAPPLLARAAAAAAAGLVGRPLGRARHCRRRRRHRRDRRTVGQRQRNSYSISIVRWRSRPMCWPTRTASSSNCRKTTFLLDPALGRAAGGQGQGGAAAAGRQPSVSASSRAGARESCSISPAPPESSKPWPSRPNRAARPAWSSNSARHRARCLPRRRARRRAPLNSQKAPRARDGRRRAAAAAGQAARRHRRRPWRRRHGRRRREKHLREGHRSRRRPATGGQARGRRPRAHPADAQLRRIRAPGRPRETRPQERRSCSSRSTPTC